MFPVYPKSWWHSAIYYAFDLINLTRRARILILKLRWLFLFLKHNSIGPCLIPLSIEFSKFIRRLLRIILRVCIHFLIMNYDFRAVLRHSQPAIETKMVHQLNVESIIILLAHYRLFSQHGHDIGKRPIVVFLFLFIIRFWLEVWLLMIVKRLLIL